MTAAIVFYFDFSSPYGYLASEKIDALFGLRAGEFLTLVDFAANLVNTKLFEFCEVNPTLDQNGQTARLVAVAMHRICSS